MNLKKSLIAGIIAAGAIATPALADLRVNVGFGVPPPPAYQVAPGYWVRQGHHYVWVRGYPPRHVHWRGHRYAYGHYR
jgi:hypothetical protein